MKVFKLKSLRNPYDYNDIDYYSEDQHLALCSAEFNKIMGWKKLRKNITVKVSKRRQVLSDGWKRGTLVKESRFYVIVDGKEYDTYNFPWAVLKRMGLKGNDSFWFKVEKA